MNNKLAANSIFVTPVILCGGSGTRLWPLSRSSFPKQFLNLSQDGSNQTLFQQAVTRVNSIKIEGKDHSKTIISPSVIVSNEEHRFLVSDQLRELSGIVATVVLEPTGLTTAPALTLAAFQSQDIETARIANNFDPILVITPADHVVGNQANFIKALQGCIDLVSSDETRNTIAIFGVTPSSPETAYGYIKHQGSLGVNQEYTVERFVEKPNKKTAENYFQNGSYLWNSGMFILHASTWLSAIKKFHPDIYFTSKAAWDSRKIDHMTQTSFVRPSQELFKLIPSESIDYAVIEKCPGSHFQVKVVELDAGWSDLGSWDAVWQSSKQDPDGNFVSGDVITSNSKNSFIYSSSRLVSAVGIDNLIVVETPDAVLVANHKNSQDVKQIVSQLNNEGREEKNLHRKVSRPWGWYDSIDQGDRFKVKRIQVKPGASLSLQMHQHRAEHWVVVKGIAEITNGDHVIQLNENQSTYIPKGQIHRLRNVGNELLEIIEIQSGEYLGEDDIVRFEDVYGRINPS